MAGNNSIQILRGRSSTWNQTDADESRQASHVVLNDGQPFFDPSSGWIFIGDGNSELKELQSIQCDYSKDCLTAKEVEDIWNGGNS